MMSNLLYSKGVLYMSLFVGLGFVTVVAVSLSARFFFRHKMLSQKSEATKHYEGMKVSECQLISQF